LISALVALALAIPSDPYVRSRVSPEGPSDHCLYWTENTTITWNAEVTGNPETGPSVFTAFEKSFATWNAQLTTCASLAFSEGPKTTSRTVGWDRTAGAKNENILVFRFKSCDFVPKTDACWQPANDDCGNKNDCWQHSSTAIAITTTTYDPQSGRILDADVEFNVPSFIFTTVDSPPCVKPNYNQSCVATDVQNTLTHEAGHMLGLAHTLYPGSTMNPTAPPGETSKRVLDPGTANFTCAAYPKGQPSKDCVIIAETTPETLGPVKTGCSAAGGALPMLVLLLRRRRR
jgi:hypothetical protein